MTDERKGLDLNDLAKFALRVSLGVMMLLHGISKLQNLDGTMGWLFSVMDAMGLPQFLAYGVFLGEVAAPVLLILGVLPRLSSLAMMGTMLVAALSHTLGENAKPLFSIGDFGGWSYELQGLYFFAALAILIAGSGKIALFNKTALSKF